VQRVFSKRLLQEKAAPETVMIRIRSDDAVGPPRYPVTPIHFSDLITSDRQARPVGETTPYRQKRHARIDWGMADKPSLAYTRHCATLENAS